MGTKKLKKLDVLKITDLEIPNRDLQSKAENTVIFPVYLQPISNLCDKFYYDIHIARYSYSNTQFHSQMHRSLLSQAKVIPILTLHG